jgi:hypothetical protein
MSKVSPKAIEFTKSAYSDNGWLVQPSPRGALTTFTASKAGKLHHVRVLLGEHTWAEGEKINFVQNAVSNLAIPIAATYVEMPTKDGVVQKVSFYDLNNGKSVRIRAPAKTPEEEKPAPKKAAPKAKQNPPN